jgi:hypothetical protein
VAPINRDVNEERLARVEQMLGDLRRKVIRLSDGAARGDAILTRANTEHARSELYRAVAVCRAQRPKRATKKH